MGMVLCVKLCLQKIRPALSLQRITQSYNLTTYKQQSLDCFVLLRCRHMTFNR